MGTPGCSASGGGQVAGTSVIQDMMKTSRRVLGNTHADGCTDTHPIDTEIHNASVQAPRPFPLLPLVEPGRDRQS